MKEIYLIYMPLFLAIFLVFLGANTYYHHKYNIEESSTLNKFKLPENHILIRWKLFKYDNNFNYFLLVPYLIAWNLFFVVLILYIVYWCGVVVMATFFTNIGFVFPLMILLLFYMGYSGIIQQVILHSNRLEKPTFITDRVQSDKTNSAEQEK